MLTVLDELTQVGESSLLDLRVILSDGDDGVDNALLVLIAALRGVQQSKRGCSQRPSATSSQPLTPSSSLTLSPANCLLPLLPTLFLISLFQPQTLPPSLSHFTAYTSQILPPSFL